MLQSEYLLFFGLPVIFGYRYHPKGVMQSQKLCEIVSPSPRWKRYHCIISTKHRNSCTLITDSLI